MWAWRCSAHPRRPALLYEARRLPSAELPLLVARGRDGAVLDQALRRSDRQCLERADAVLVTTGLRAEEVRAAGRAGAVHLVPDGIETGPPCSRGSRDRCEFDTSAGTCRAPDSGSSWTRSRRSGRGARLHLVQPRGKPWDASLQREVSAAARSGAVTSGPPGALPGDLGGRGGALGDGPDARAPAALGDALEAYARGRPVLAPDSEAARGELPAGCTVFFPGADGDALGRALVALASSPDLLAESGAEARAYVERRHDAARVRGLLRDLYRAHGAVPSAWQARFRAVGGPRCHPDGVGLPGCRASEHRRAPTLARPPGGSGKLWPP